jgi:hypothetical protein
MQSDPSAVSTSKKALWTGRIISGVVALFLLWAGVMDLIKAPSVVQGMVKYGYPESSIVGIGIALLLGVALYILPHTSVLGAIVLTGYLGGAVSTHVRAGDPVGRILFPLVFGLLIWGGIYLRDVRLRALLPLVRPR